MRALSSFLRRELLALLGDDADSEQSEDSESQPWSEPSQRPQPGDAPRVVLGGKTDSAAQTLVLVDSAHCMTAVVPVRVADALRAKLNFQSLGRLNGSVIRIDKYRFVTRDRCLQSDQLAPSARANWGASVSLASSTRRQQRVYLWVEELSVLHESELAVKQRPDAIEDAAVLEKLNALNDSELEMRLSIRQKLPPLAANPRPSSPQRFDDSNPLTDADCIIPDEQERELDEQDGWGAPSATDSNPLPTDSQLIAENGPVSMSESQEPSQILSDIERDEHGVVDTVEEVERDPETPPARSSSRRSRATRSRSKAKSPDKASVGKQSSSETEDEFEGHQSPRGANISKSNEEVDAGSVNEPIDLTGDDDDSEATPNFMYEDPELFTQAPDGESQRLDQTQDVKWSQVERERDQGDEDLPLHTQLIEDEEETEDVNFMTAMQDSEERHVGGEGELESEDIPANPSGPSNQAPEPAADETSNISDGEADEPDQNKDTSPELVPSDEHRTQTTRAGDSGDSRQSRGLVGSFFRRLPSLFGIGSSPAKSQPDQDPKSPPRSPKNSSPNTNQSEEETEVTPPEEGSNSLANFEQSSSVAVGDDVDMWQTQAPDTVDEGALSPVDHSFEFNPGYNEDDDEEDWNGNGATTMSGVASKETSSSSAGGYQATVEPAHVPNTDDHSEMAASGSVWAPSQYQTPPSQGKKRARANASSPERFDQSPHSPAPSTRSMRAIPSLAHQHHPESEEQKENDSPVTPKRRRVDGAPRADISTANLATSRVNLALQVSISSVADEGHGGPLRPSKRYESLFPPLNMDRIKWMISQRR